MRQLMIKVPAGEGQKVLAYAQQHNGRNITFLEAAAESEKCDLLIVNLPNHRLGDLLEALEELPDMEMTLIPHSVLPLSPPASEVPNYIKEVQPRSPVEIWLNAQQSVGSWPSFLGYTLAGSVIVWIAMFTNSIFLLVAAMLVSPFAGPAMNTAVATATGDKDLLRQSIGRYFVSLGVMVAASAILSLVLGLETATSTMVNVSEVSAVALLLPLVAGAAGTLNLVQAENSSLVSGTAVGILVAASLAPPAGLIGMAGAIQRWDMTVNGIFLLLLQLVGINLAGTLVFRRYGLSPQGARFHRGQSRYYYGSVLVSIVLLTGLLAWQFTSSPSLQRSTQAQRALPIAEQVLNQRSDVRLVEANFRFTRPPGITDEKEALLGVLYVERIENTGIPNETLQRQIEEAIQQQLIAEGFNVKPLINATMLEPPSSLKAGN